MFLHIKTQAAIIVLLILLTYVCMVYDKYGIYTLCMSKQISISLTDITFSYVNTTIELYGLGYTVTDKKFPFLLHSTEFLFLSVGVLLPFQFVLAILVTERWLQPSTNTT